MPKDDPKRPTEASIAAATNGATKVINKLSDRAKRALIDKLAPGELARLVKRSTAVIPDVPEGERHQFDGDASQPVGGLLPRTPFQIMKDGLTNDLTHGGTAGNLQRTWDMSQQLYVKIKSLEPNEWMQATKDGAAILGCADRLKAADAKWGKLMTKMMGNLAAEIFRAEDDAALAPYLEIKNEIPEFFKDYNEIVNLVVHRANALVDDEVWKAAAAPEVSLAKKAAATGLFAALGAILGFVKTAAPPGFGISSAAAGGQAALNQAKSRFDVWMRDAKIKELKAAKGPDWPYQVLSANNALVAQRVCAKQKEFAATILDVIAVAGAEIPGWSAIRKGAEVAMFGYFDGRVVKLQEFLEKKAAEKQLLPSGGATGDAAASFTTAIPGKVKEIKEETVEFVEADVPITFINEVKLELNAATDEAVKEIREAKDSRDKSWMEKLGEVFANLGENSMDIAKEIVEGSFEHIVKTLITKVVAYLLAKTPISMAQQVSGYDFMEIVRDLDDSINSVRRAQTGQAVDYNR